MKLTIHPPIEIVTNERVLCHEYCKWLYDFNRCYLFSKKLRLTSSDKLYRCQACLDAEKENSNVSRR